MTFGVQALDTSGNVLWDSRTVGSGVVADVISLAPGASLTRDYPAFPGRQSDALVLNGFGNLGIYTDSALGHPRVNVPSHPEFRRVMVLVF